MDTLIRSEVGEYDEASIPLTENARAVLSRRYLRKGPDGEPVETVTEMFHRVAHHIALAEREWDGDVEAAEEAFYNFLTQLRFFPNSPTFTGAGTPLGQLAACFVLPISDDMGRDESGIFQSLRDAALIQQTGGGNGFSFSRLRPKGALVTSSAGQATGPVGFLRVYDQAFGEIAQGGTRRGANMAVLRVDHPDILDFIRCKTSEDAITNFNISVGITDAFMQAVQDDADFELVSPQDGQVWRTVKAREIFDEIVKYAHHNGEPGVLFLDTANRANPVPHLYDLEATNPCLVGDTWVVTDQGPVQVKNLVGRPTRLLSNGEFYPTNDKGFFCTGERGLLKIRTRRGFCIQVTSDHPLRKVTRMTRYVVESEWRAAASLQTGDKIVLSDNRRAQWQGKGTFKEGYLLGVLVGDGTITSGKRGKEGKAVISVWGEGPGPTAMRKIIEEIAFTLPHRADFKGFIWIPERQEGRLILKSIYDLSLDYGLSRDFKGVSPEIEQTSSEFHRGFLRGLFDADGTVIGSQQKGVSVRLSQSNIALLESVQRMLHRLGVVSTIYRNRHKARKKSLPDGQGGYDEYDTKANHELSISGANLVEFVDKVGFVDVEKIERLDALMQSYRRRLNRERFVDEIVSVVPQGQSLVYDAHVLDVHAFDANGFWVHNCGEQWLGPYENCCLGSINLACHIAQVDGRPAVDWEKLQETVELATRFLDDVVTVNAYVPAVPQLEVAAYRARRIGLGIMGLGDMLYRMGIRYGSETAQEFAAQVMEFVRYHAMRISVQLAEARGAFPAIEGSIYDPQDLCWTPPQPLRAYRRDFDRPQLYWARIVDGIRAHGIRNAAQTTVAPTGTIATVTGCEAYGCEPVFALAYVRHVNDNGQDLALTYTSPLFKEALREAGLDAPTRQRIIDQVSKLGSCQKVEAAPEPLRHTFVVAQDIAPEEHVRMQAAIQTFVDNSISKTCNFAATATERDVADTYFLAWKLGCKGLTVYVTGSREKVVLETQKTQAAQDPSTLQPTLFHESKKPRPRMLPGETYRISTPLGTTFVTVNRNGGKEPFEVFMHTSKAGSETAAVSEAMGRLISYILRLASPVPPRDRLVEVVQQLGGIGGGRPLGFGAERVRSLPDGIAQVLAEYLDQAPSGDNGRVKPTDGRSGGGEPGQLTFRIGDLCPECGEAAFVREEGCRKCYACGYSEC
jgi:ribonucleoside-diphosphate reductase alpha chain